jgi:dienelactone hydrolase
MPSESAQTALHAIEMARADRFSEIRELFPPNLRILVTSEALRAGWHAALEQQGLVSAVGEPMIESSGPGMVVARVPVRCERGALTVVVSMSDSGRLTGIQLAPASAALPVAPWEPPPYVDSQKFDEEDLTLGSGPLAVPGTLSVARRSGAGPAIVLLAGSGPMDRDETLGRNKPFKDLAWGLASRGVTVLRFDKVTYAHGSEIQKNPHFTVVDEYLPDTVAALHLLSDHLAVDPKRTFVLGHSLGGTVAPRIAAAEPSVAGLVILAGGAEPLHWSAVRQVRYLAALDPTTSAASEPAIEVLIKQARRIDSPELSESTPAGELPLGVPAPYWLDLRAYDPVAVAASLKKPMLILQGGRDYQATVADDLSLWEAGLAGRPDVTIRVYPEANHMFFAGSGPSTPADYEAVRHVDPTVVADIASWLSEGVPSCGCGKPHPSVPCGRDSLAGRRRPLPLEYRRTTCLSSCSPTRMPRPLSLAHAQAPFLNGRQMRRSRGLT